MFVFVYSVSLILAPHPVYFQAGWLISLSLDKGNSIYLQINPNTKGDSLISGIFCDTGLSKDLFNKFCFQEM